MKTSLLFLLIISSLAFPQWNRTNGPEGVSVSCLVNIGGTIYAGTGVDGVYESKDDGKSWIPINDGIETLEVNSILSEGGYLLAGTFGGGVYRSADGGLTWNPPSNANNIAVTGMAVKDSFIFACSIQDGLYRSSDNGQTWTLKLSAFGLGPVCVSGNTILASEYGYTFASTDNGENWNYVTDLEGAAPFSFYCKDSLVIAGCVNEIYKSIDYGNSFTEIQLSFPFSIVNIYDIAAIGSTLFMATSYDGVYKSDDDGLTWTPANFGMGPKDVRALTVGGSSTLIAGTHYVGIYRSTDMGSSWNKSMAGFPAGSSIESMLATNDFIFAGTRDGVYRTGDNGVSWTKLGGANDTVNYSGVRGLCELNGAIYAGMRIQFRATVYKSIDAGQTWTRSGSGLPDNLVFIDALTTSNDNIIAATDEGIYYSSDEGDSWHLANAPNLSIPYVAAGGGYAYAILPNQGIYKSADGGVNWSLSLGSTVDYVRLAAVDNFVYAGSFFQGARYSSNNGSSWFVSGGFPSDASIFALAPVGNGIVLAGTDLGPNWIYASFNDGVSYSPYSQGLGERADAEAFAVNDSFMFAGTDYHGVWRRLRPGVVSVQTSPEVPQIFNLAQNFPNPFNPTTTIQYTLPHRAKVLLKIYDVLGNEIRTLIDETQSSGIKSVVWDSRDDNGKSVSSGIYFYQLKSGSNVQTKRMILLK
jgi:photosystem II stability/assembly factor-like uncharacterized protein